VDDAPHVRSTEPKPEDSMTWLRDEETQFYLSRAVGVRAVGDI